MKRDLWQLFDIVLSKSSELVFETNGGEILENNGHGKTNKVRLVWRKRSRNIYQMIFTILAEHKEESLPEYLYIGSMRIGLNRKRVPLRIVDNNSYSLK